MGIEGNLVFQNNPLTGPVLLILREKFSPGPGFEPGSPALHAGTLTNWATQTTKLTKWDLPEGYAEKLNFHQNLPICVVNIKSPN